MTDNFEGREAERMLEWSHSQFIARMIKAAEGDEITVNEMPNRIDLAGPLGKNCDILREQTMNDTESRERAKVVKLANDGKTILISEHASVGKFGGVTPNEYRQHPEHRTAQYIGKGKPIISLHTHDIDLPPSPTDLIGFFLKPEEGGLSGVIVITPERKFLLMRTKGTPLMSQREAIADAREHSIRAEKGIWEAGLKYERDNRGASFEETWHNNAKLTEQIRKAELLKVCQNSDIELFTAMGESNLFYKGYNS